MYLFATSFPTHYNRKKMKSNKILGRDNDYHSIRSSRTIPVIRAVFCLWFNLVKILPVSSLSLQMFACCGHSVNQPRQNLVKAVFEETYDINFSGSVRQSVFHFKKHQGPKSDWFYFILFIFFRWYNHQVKAETIHVAFYVPNWIINLSVKSNSWPSI